MTRSPAVTASRQTTSTLIRQMCIAALLAERQRHYRSSSRRRNAFRACQAATHAHADLPPDLACYFRRERPAYPQRDLAEDEPLFDEVFRLLMSVRPADSFRQRSFMI